MRIGNIRIKKRFFIITVVLAAIVILGIIGIINSSAVSKLEWGVLKENQFLDGIVLRDETTFSIGQYGRIDYLKYEGDTVAEGDVIANKYSTDYIELRLKDLENTRKQIESYQRQIMNTVVNEDLDKLDVDISNKIKEISEAQSKDDYSSAIKKKIELDLMLEQRRTLLREKTKADFHLQELYDEEKRYEDTINQWKTEITAPSDGILSFYSDGLEESLPFDNIDDVFKLDLKDIMAKAKSSAKENQAVYRIVNTEKWYIVLVSEINPVLTAGSEVELYQHGSDKAINAKFIKESKEGSLYICVFEVEAEMGDLANTRVTQFSINKPNEGLIVDNSAIKTKDGLQGIYIKENGKKEFVYVQVVATAGNKSIITGLPDGVQPKAGQTVYR